VDSGPIASVGYRFVARGRSGDRVTSAHGSTVLVVTIVGDSWTVGGLPYTETYRGGGGLIRGRQLIYPTYNRVYLPVSLTHDRADTDRLRSRPHTYPFAGWRPTTRARRTVASAPHDHWGEVVYALRCAATGRKESREVSGQPSALGRSASLETKTHPLGSRDGRHGPRGQAASARTPAAYGARQVVAGDRPSRLSQCPSIALRYRAAAFRLTFRKNSSRFACVAWNC
jgi:hypothetical protein